MVQIDFTGIIKQLLRDVELLQESQIRSGGLLDEIFTFPNESITVATDSLGSVTSGTVGGYLVGTAIVGFSDAA